MLKNCPLIKNSLSSIPKNDLVKPIEKIVLIERVININPTNTHTSFFQSNQHKSCILPIICNDHIPSDR